MSSTRLPIGSGARSMESLLYVRKKAVVESSLELMKLRTYRACSKWTQSFELQASILVDSMTGTKKEQARMDHGELRQPMKGRGSGTPREIGSPLRSKKYCEVFAMVMI